MTSDPQTAASVAERVRLTAAQEARAYLSTPITPEWFGRELVSKLLAEHDEAAAGLEQVRDDLVRARDDSSETWLAERNEEMRDALTVAAELIARLAAPGPCDVDGDGACRGHEGFATGYLAPCPHPLGRRFVEAWRAVQTEAAKKGAGSPQETGGPSPRPTPEGRDAYRGS